MKNQPRHLPVWTRSLRKRAWALLVGLAVAQGGCGLFELAQSSKGSMSLGGKKLVVLPFSMPGRSYFESDFGARFAREVARVLAASDRRATVVDPDGLPQSLVQEGARTLKAGDVIDVPSLLRLGERLEADYLMAGEIHDVRARDRKSFGVLHGTMVVSARLVDVAEGRVVWRAEEKTFRYPPPVAGVEMIPADEREEREVIKKLLVEAAKGMAAPFLGRQRSVGESVEGFFH